MANAGVGPAGYHETWYGAREWRFYRGIVADVVALSEPGPILDVGAGAGLFVEAARRWGLSCVGVEGAADAIALAERRCPGLALHHHLLSEPLPFPDASFQTAIWNQVIEHLEPGVAERALRESRRVLRPGGALLVYSPSRANRAERDADPTHVHLYAPAELRDLLLRVGFERIVARDAALEVFGRSRAGRLLAHALFRATAWQRLAATANCVAYAPGAAAGDSGLRPASTEIVSPRSS
jgi:SAM-dependent methyltransferase